MEQERNFKGIWIPKEIWLTNELSLQEKVVLVEIDSLDDEEKGCFASNKYFADFFKLTTGRVSQIIKQLQNKGYLDIKYNYKGKEITERLIRVKRPPYPDVFNKLNTCLENDDRGIKNIKEGYLENCEDNNIDTNNINNINNKEIYKESWDCDAYVKRLTEVMVDFLNERTGRNYKTNNPKTQSLVRARLREGFREADFDNVIETKCDEWLDTDMEKYLRPDTLFGTKFENYANQRRKR